MKVVITLYSFIPILYEIKVDFRKICVLQCAKSLGARQSLETFSLGLPEVCLRYWLKSASINISVLSRCLANSVMRNYLKMQRIRSNPTEYQTDYCFQAFSSENNKPVLRFWLWAYKFCAPQLSIIFILVFHQHKWAKRDTCVSVFDC